MSIDAPTVYDFSAKRIDGRLESLDVYRGKVLLIVNVASRCGFTPQYAMLESLYRENREKGFEVLGFPCNQFAQQEPGSDEEIAKFCNLKYDVTFPMYSKVDVNGNDADPLFTFLRKSLRGLLWMSRIQWNFTKFLIDRNGIPRRRFGPAHPSVDFKSAVSKLLAQ